MVSYIGLHVVSLYVGGHRYSWIVIALSWLVQVFIAVELLSHVFFNKCHKTVLVFMYM